MVRVVGRDGAGSSWYVLASCSDLAGSRLSNTFSCFSVVFLNVHVFEFPSEQCYMDTVRVSVSDSGAGVRFVRIFGDTANNTWNPTRVSESDTGAGYPTRQKN